MTGNAREKKRYAARRFTVLQNARSGPPPPRTHKRGTPETPAGTGQQERRHERGSSSWYCKGPQWSKCDSLSRFVCFSPLLVRLRFLCLRTACARARRTDDRCTRVLDPCLLSVFSCLVGSVLVKQQRFLTRSSFVFFLRLGALFFSPDSRSSCGLLRCLALSSLY